MKKFTLSMVVAFSLCAAAAVAQMAPGSSGQGTQQSSPTMGGPQGRQQPGMGQPGQNDPTGQTGQDQTGNMNHNDNGEHKLKGCVQSQGGQYVLETKKGKMVALTGQDVSAHVGHEVAVKGTWAASGMSPSSTGTASSDEKSFNVSDVKMISDTCGGKSKHSDNGMGTGTTNPANTGAGTQGPSGTGSQPPQ